MPIKEFGDTITHIDGTLVLPNDSGEGIKLGRFSESAGFGWRDVSLPIVARGSTASPVTDPAWAEIGSTGFYAHTFAINDEVWFGVPLPHDIVPGSAIRFHTHWCPNITSGNFVTWSWLYAYAKGFNQATFDFALATSPLTAAANTVTATQAAGGATSPQTTYKHMVTRSADVAIDAEPGGLIYVRQRRVANATSPEANFAGTVYVLSAGIQYQSTNMATIQATPDFYADL